MTKDEFRELIAESRRGAADDIDAQMDRLRELLRELPPKGVVSLDRRFPACARAAFRNDPWAAAYIMNGGCSDVGFDYFVGWLVAQGRAYFEAALADPPKAGRRVQPGDEVECCDMWVVAAHVYEEVTDEDYTPMASNVIRTLRGKGGGTRRQSRPCTPAWRGSSGDGVGATVSPTRERGRAPHPSLACRATYPQGVRLVFECGPPPSLAFTPVGGVHRGR